MSLSPAYIKISQNVLVAESINLSVYMQGSPSPLVFKGVATSMVDYLAMTNYYLWSSYLTFEIASLQKLLAYALPFDITPLEQRINGLNAFLALINKNWLTVLSTIDTNNWYSGNSCFTSFNDLIPTFAAFDSEQYTFSPTSAAIYRTDWQGRQLLYDTPRTNIVSNTDMVDGNNNLLPNWLSYGVSDFVGGQSDPAGGNGAILVSLVSGSYFGIYCNASDVSATTQNTVTAWLKTTASGGSVLSLGTDDEGATVNVQVTTSWQRFEVQVGHGSNNRVFQCICTKYDDPNFPPFFLYAPQTEVGNIGGVFIPNNTSSSATVTDYTLSGNEVTLSGALPAGDILDWSGSYIVPPSTTETVSEQYIATGDGASSIYYLTAPASSAFAESQYNAWSSAYQYAVGNTNVPNDTVDACERMMTLSESYIDVMASLTFPSSSQLSSNLIWNQIVALPLYMQLGDLLSADFTSPYIQQFWALKMLAINSIKLNSYLYFVGTQQYSSQPPPRSQILDGETLMAFAARTTGSYENWLTIAQINNLSSPYVSTINNPIPNTAQAGDYLYLPPGPSLVPTTFSVDVLGTDIDLGPFNQDMTWGGDFQISVGLHNYEEAIIRRVTTPLNTYIYDPSYGSMLPLEMGTAISADAGRLGNYAESAILSDPRTKSVDSVYVQGNAQVGAYFVTASITPIGYDKAILNISG